MQIKRDDLSGPEIAELLKAHLADFAPHSPPESRHALDLSALRHPDVHFYSAWEDGELLGCGAFKRLDATHAELKSMRTGVGRALLTRLIEEARAAGFERLSLETGSAAHFDPAHRLYAAFGFETCGPFGDYVEDPYSVFMTRRL